MKRENHLKLIIRTEHLLEWGDIVHIEYGYFKRRVYGKITGMENKPPDYNELKSLSITLLEDSIDKFTTWHKDSCHSLDCNKIVFLELKELSKLK